MIATDGQTRVDLTEEAYGFTLTIEKEGEHHQVQLTFSELMRLHDLVALATGSDYVSQSWLER